LQPGRCAKELVEHRQPALVAAFLSEAHEQFIVRPADKYLLSRRPEGRSFDDPLRQRGIILFPAAFSYQPLLPGLTYPGMGFSLLLLLGQNT
jgi:hypothetical protein